MSLTWEMHPCILQKLGRKYALQNFVLYFTFMNVYLFLICVCQSHVCGCQSHVCGCQSHVCVCESHVCGCLSHVWVSKAALDPLELELRVLKTGLKPSARAASPLKCGAFSPALLFNILPEVLVHVIR